jgi:hypothetical protein
MGRLSFTELRSRLSDRVDRAARGTDIPAGIERGEITPPSGSRERGRMRRRLRELRRLREALLLELGALVLEAHRHDRDDSPVIKRKAAEAATVDSEARAIADALGTDGGLDTIVAAGIAGPCPTCGTLTSTAARFCPTCGTALDGRPDAAPAQVAEPVVVDAPVPDLDAPQAADPDAPAITEADAVEGLPGSDDTAPSSNGDGNPKDEPELEATAER